jgi:hypothetical protein
MEFQKVSSKGSSWLGETQKVPAQRMIDFTKA